MNRPWTFTVLLSLLMQLSMISNTKSEQIDVEKLYKDERIDEKLSLLGPQLLLKTYKIDDIKETNFVNPSCARDFIHYKEAIDRRESWALSMLDASTHTLSGTLKGNIIDLGMYDECTAAMGTSSEIEIHGRHCMYNIRFLNILYITILANGMLTICLPSTCTEQDVVMLMNNMINERPELNDLSVEVDSAFCSREVPFTWDTELCIFLCFLVFYLGFQIVCTIIDLKNRRCNSKNGEKNSENFTTQFSMLKSAETILSTEVQEGDLVFIHGIRFISIAFIILFHITFVQIFEATVNKVDMIEYFSSWILFIPYAGILAVDIFFILSGFLMTYTFFRQMKKNKTFNIPQHYAHRYLRLTPPMVMFVLFMYIILPRVISGPLASVYLDKITTNCRPSWWYSILYLININDKNPLCMRHLWQISVDMQLYLISPLILYPLHKKPKLGFAIIAILLMISVVVTTLIVGINKYPAIYIPNDLNITRAYGMFENYYLSIYTRVSPWLIGILLAYEITHQNIKLNKTINSIGWICTIGAFAFCIFNVRSLTHKSYEYDPIWEIIVAALYKLCWGFGVSWIIYTCFHNPAGLISKILSWKFFVPLSRITYCICLSHIILPIINFLTMRTAFFSTVYSMVRGYIVDLLLSIILGFVLSVVAEMPFLSMNDLIFKRKRDNKIINVSNIKNKNQ